MAVRVAALVIVRWLSVTVRDCPLLTDSATRM